ncbi:hypothetical protein ACHAPT_006874 [Fusarium lateritium]
MESTDPVNYQVALILPQRSDYEAAVKLLDLSFDPPSLPSSGAEYALGKVGPHHLVLVTGRETTTTADSVASLVPDLLNEYPSIRAGFLVGVGAIAPSDGLAQAGDIVLGVPQGYESGMVQFDADKSRHQQRLHVTGRWAKPPGSVEEVIDYTLSPQGCDEWRDYLAKHLPTMTHSNEEAVHASPSNEITLPSVFPPQVNSMQGAPKVLKGRVASSSEPLSDLVLLRKLGSDSGILCFETAAAKLRGHLPLVTICGVTGTTARLERQEGASKVASAYAMFLACQLNPIRLAHGLCLGQLFHHRPLSLERPSFRLLRLEPGTGSKLHCSMFEAYLDDPDMLIEYEVLSYARDDNATRHAIYVDGQTLPVPDNLYGALHHLHGRDQPSILWEDAICIDQSNVTERGHQVAQMGSIYEKANRVIIWLGSVGEDARLLISTLKSLQQQTSSRPFRTWQYRDSLWKQAWEEIHGGDVPQARLRRLAKGLEELTEKPWFKRTCIIQEVAMARSGQIRCSAGAVKAGIFALAPWLLGCSGSQQSQLALLPGKFKSPPQTTVDLFKVTLQKGSEAVDRFFEKTVVTKDDEARLAYAAAEGIHPSVKLMEDFYLGRWKHEFEISELMAARLLWTGPDMVRVFLQSKTNKLQITEALLRRASENPDTYKLLLERHNEEKDISEEEAIQAIQGGPETLRRRLNEHGTNFRVTGNIFEAAIHSGRDVTEILLSRRESEANIYEEVQEIYELRENDRKDILHKINTKKHTKMLREALTRYKRLGAPEPRGMVTASPNHAGWQRAAGMKTSRWRHALTLFWELRVCEEALETDPEE